MRYGTTWPSGIATSGSSRPTGGTPWRVTDDVAIDWAPVWSADGHSLIFSSDRGGSMNLWRIAVNPADRARRVGAAGGHDAGWIRRAGPVLQYRAHAWGGPVAETTSNIYRASFDPARATVGAFEAVTTGSRTFRFIDPSPDGQFLVLGTSYLQQEDLFISRIERIRAAAAHDGSVQRPVPRLVAEGRPHRVLLRPERQIRDLDADDVRRTAPAHRRG